MMHIIRSLNVVLTFVCSCLTLTKKLCRMLIVCLFFGRTAFFPLLPSDFLSFFHVGFSFAAFFRSLLSFHISHPIRSHYLFRIRLRSLQNSYELSSLSVNHLRSVLFHRCNSVPCCVSLQRRCDSTIMSHILSIWLNCRAARERACST